MGRMWEAVDSQGLDKAVETAALFSLCRVCCRHFLTAHVRTPSPFYLHLQPLKSANFLLCPPLTAQNFVLCYGFCFIHSGKNFVCNSILLENDALHA